MSEEEGCIRGSLQHPLGIGARAEQLSLGTHEHAADPPRGLQFIPDARILANHLAYVPHSGSKAVQHPGSTEA